MTDTEKWIEEAREIAAQCWRTVTTAGSREPIVQEAVAQRIAGWMRIADTHLSNERYYRGLLIECAKHLGPPVYVNDEVPELVRVAAEQVEALSLLRTGVLGLAETCEKTPGAPRAIAQALREMLGSVAGGQEQQGG